MYIVAHIHRVHTCKDKVCIQHVFSFVPKTNKQKTTPANNYGLKWRSISGIQNGSHLTHWIKLESSVHYHGLICILCSVRVACKLMPLLLRLLHQLDDHLEHHIDDRFINWNYWWIFIGFMDPTSDSDGICIPSISVKNYKRNPQTLPYALIPSRLLKIERSNDKYYVLSTLSTSSR